MRLRGTGRAEERATNPARWGVRASLRRRVGLHARTIHKDACRTVCREIPLGCGKGGVRH